MSAPTWPQLAGWAATSSLGSARGTWRAVRDGVETAGSYVWRAPDVCVVTGGAGEPDGQLRRQAEDVSALLRPTTWSRDGGTPSGPPRPVVVAGRDAWEVVLTAAARSGASPGDATSVEVVVVDETGVVLRLTRPGARVELTSLEVDAAVGVDELAVVEDRARRAEELQQLSVLCMTDPPPTPRWLPGRRQHVDDGTGRPVVSVLSAELSRWAPDEQPVPSTWHGQHVVLHRAGWTWQYSHDGPAPPLADLERLVDELEEP